MIHEGLAVAADDLSAPLGQDKTHKRARGSPRRAEARFAGLLGLFVAVFVGWAMIADDPFGGEPVAVVPADLRGRNAGKKPDEVAARPPVPGTPDRPNRHDGPAMDSTQPSAPPDHSSKTVTIIDGTSGKRQEVVIGGGSDDQALDRRAVDRDVAPRPASQGRAGRLAPLEEIYARPVKAPQQADAPRIAIVVGGLGISASGTSDALGKLPGPVTLAFAPYGTNLAQLGPARAREGHEVLLQVPMEPFDYPDNDPGRRRC